MRRFIVATAGVVVALVLAGCAQPAGVDGDLTNNWPAMPAARTAVPAAGVCYPRASSDGQLPALDTWTGGDFKPVSCDDDHQLESVYVGTFTGDDSDASSVLTADSPAEIKAFSQCRTEAQKYLGDDYHDGLFELGMMVPDQLAWLGGARWYRCDLERFSNGDMNEVAEHGSVKGGLSGSRSMALTCETITEDAAGKSIIESQVADCASPHNAEFAGLYTAPDEPWPADQKTRDNLAQNGCEKVVATYLGLSGGRDTNQYLGWYYEEFDEDLWRLGDRTTRCFLAGLNGNTVNGVKIVGSVKGIRGGKPRSS